MKLSEILGWKEKTGEGDAGEVPFSFGKTIGYNTALKFCDREIDRGELKMILLKYEHSFEGLADHIISTMPTWLKRIEE